ncbi:hypothetical protein ScPMuIL_008105 [Solemya velum]
MQTYELMYLFWSLPRFKSHPLDSEVIHIKDPPTDVTEPTHLQTDTVLPSEKPAIIGQTVWCTNIADAILKSDMVETRLDKVRSSDFEKKPRSKSQPERTIAYTVKDSDSLESIAAFYDTTPSELKKLNKLPSRMIFPGQVMYIPDGISISPTPPSPVSSPKEAEVFLDNRPKMDIPIVKLADRPPAKIPGHAERQTPVSSPTEKAGFDIPTKLSGQEVEKLDRECTERFIKVDVKYITDGQGVVSGVLLVTPNAVMFDPYMSDPLVIEHGPEKYGIMAPVDMIVRAAMYHDIAAMRYHKQKEEGEEVDKPEVYHDITCPLYQQRVACEASGREADIEESIGKDMPRSSTVASEMSETSSVCSCTAGSMGLTPSLSNPIKLQMAVDPKSASQEPIVSSVCEDDCLKQNDTIEFKSINNSQHVDKNSSAPENVMDSVLDSSSTSNSLNKKEDRTIGDSMREVFHPCLESSKNDSGLELTLDIGPSRTNGNTIVTGPDSIYANGGEIDNGSGKTEIEQSEVVSAFEQNSVKTDEEIISSKFSDPQAVFDSKTEVQTEEVGGVTKGEYELAKQKGDSPENRVFEMDDMKMGENNTIEPSVAKKDKTSPQGELRIGNIVYLPVEEDVKGQITLKGMEKTTEALLKFSSEDFKQNKRSKSESDSVFLPENKSTSSFSSFRAPPLSAFVNYATGLFRSEPGDRDNVKDIQDALEDSQDRVKVENAVKLADKPELFLSFDKLIPRPALCYEDPPLYLCLCLGNPINKEVSKTCPIQSYAKKKKKPEYWFSIPRNKVDSLYAFFVQWTPEIYGDEIEMDPHKRGFVVIEEDDNCFDDDGLHLHEEYFGNTYGLHKDWEIISQEEATRRRSIDLEEPLPLPELIGESVILTEIHLFQINQFLPPRTIGYPWTLVYSTEKHGFSLKTLYRGMHGIDSPTLLVVRDTSDHIFGAMLSCALKVSDHFYGTGESFLFSFYPDFKVFRWTGENNFFLKGNNESLSIGAGQGLFGLWFDGDLYHGRTHRCETYDNDLLTESEDFVVKTLEAWVFVQE